MTPFAHTSGPRDAKIALVGEAWGRDEEALGGRPFVGATGRELGRLLNEAGIVRNPLPSHFMSPKAMNDWWTLSPVLCTNVLALRPPNNNMDALCVKRAEVGANYPMPALRQGKYLRSELLVHVERLAAEITAFQRNVVIALGNVACWGLLHATKISSIRGTVTQSFFEPKVKVLPTYHPASLFKGADNWANRPIILSDLIKAKYESEFPEVRRQSRKVLYSATLDELAAWLEANKDAEEISVDTETAGGYIKCVSFAASPTECIVVKFYDPLKPSARHFEAEADERKAWRLVAKILALPAAKVFQNGLYDLQYFYKMGIHPRNCTEDTMILHHSHWPEMLKGLGFLGSIYCNEPAWKLMRQAELTNKRDE